MPHLLAATRREYQKMGRVATPRRPRTRGRVTGVFNDLDATLKAVLDDAAAPADLRAADVSFDTPDKDFKPAQATVNLFLHEVIENRALRDEARVMQRVGNGVHRARPAAGGLHLPGHRVVGAGRRAQGPRSTGSWGWRLQWLSRFPVLDERFLRGSLQTPPQPYPLSTVVAQPAGGQVEHEFWTALGCHRGPRSRSPSRSV